MERRELGREGREERSPGRGEPTTRGRRAGVRLRGGGEGSEEALGCRDPRAPPGSAGPSVGGGVEASGSPGGVSSEPFSGIMRDFPANAGAGELIHPEGGSRLRAKRETGGAARGEGKSPPSDRRGALGGRGRRGTEQNVEMALPGPLGHPAC